jgi:hypothetical protein
MGLERVWEVAAAKQQQQKHVGCMFYVFIGWPNPFRHFAPIFAHCFFLRLFSATGASAIATPKIICAGHAATRTYAEKKST